VFHGCHRDLVHYQNDVSFELLNFMELIGEAMGTHIPDVYKRLSLIADVDAILADTADMIAAHRMDIAMVRQVVVADMFGGKAP
jgi:heterodisulfide reductase subunit D